MRLREADKTRVFSGGSHMPVHSLLRAASLALALGLLAPPAASAAGDPLVGCWNKKLKAAGKFTKKAGSCFAKAANRGPFWSPSTLEASFEACGVIQLEKLTRSWEKADAKAIAQGVDAAGIARLGPEDQGTQPWRRLDGRHFEEEARTGLLRFGR